MNVKNYISGLNRVINNVRHLGFSPSRDWVVMLSGAFVLGFLWVCVNAVMFVKVYRGELFIVTKEENNSVQIIKRADLQKVVEEISLREKNFSAIKSGSINTLDPTR